MADKLLFEIGTEEIPAKFMGAALKDLADIAGSLLASYRLGHGDIRSYGTPRRLVLIISNLSDRQPDLMEEVKGPAKKAAFDAAGQPTKAALGFARSQGVTVDSLVVREILGGEYVFAVKQVTGRPTVEILPDLLKELVTKISFPKPMRWGSGEMRFARPIRWLFALYGRQVVDFDLEGLKTARITYGHRFLAKEPVFIEHPDQYLTALKENFVIVDQEERRQLIWRQIQELAAAEGGRVQLDEDLLEEITYLVEYPTALCGKFSDDFLRLPPEVLITPMQGHQRYFPVFDQDGKLMAKFIAVRNGNDAYLDIVTAGNEKVLRARLEDAKFFYEEDRAIPLADYVPRLQKIVFLENFGSLYDKTQRLVRLVKGLAGAFGLSGDSLAYAERAAYLAKADLVTNMVYEFPELQGIMGRYYAENSGEAAEVAEGILEHYLPKGAGDRLPASPVGAVVSIADKIDNITGCFAAGIQPTGSQDPYALRRQALGICHIIIDRNLKLPLSNLIMRSLAEYRSQLEIKLDQESVLNDIREFFRQRLRNLLIDKGYKYDEVDAVLAAEAENPAAAVSRVEALADFRLTDDFQHLITVFNRAGNLARKADTAEVDPKHFVEQVEEQLYTALQEAQLKVKELYTVEDYRGILFELAKLRKVVDGFFSAVMVMVEDDRLRANRLALLYGVWSLMRDFADLAKISG